MAAASAEAAIAAVDRLRPCRRAVAERVHVDSDQHRSPAPRSRTDCERPGLGARRPQSAGCRSCLPPQPSDGRITHPRQDHPKPSLAQQGEGAQADGERHLFLGDRRPEMVTSAPGSRPPCPGSRKTVRPFHRPVRCVGDTRAGLEGVSARRGRPATRRVRASRSLEAGAPARPPTPLQGDGQHGSRARPLRVLPSSACPSRRRPRSDPAPTCRPGRLVRAAGERCWQAAAVDPAGAGGWPGRSARRLRCRGFRARRCGSRS